MNKSILMMALFGAVIFTGCKKHDDNREYSTWYVNGQLFRTNDVEDWRDKGGTTVIRSSGIQNSFTIIHYYTSIPTSGSLPIFRDNGAAIDSIAIDFYYGGKFYIPSTFDYDARLFMSRPKDKIQLSLPDTWFISYDNNKDSVKISGTFSEP